MAVELGLLEERLDLMVVHKGILVGNIPQRRILFIRSAHKFDTALQNTKLIMTSRDYNLISLAKLYLISHIHQDNKPSLKDLYT